MGLLPRAVELMGRRRDSFNGSHFARLPVTTSGPLAHSPAQGKDPKDHEGNSQGFQDEVTTMNTLSVTAGRLGYV